MFRQCRSTTVVIKVKLYCFRGCGSTMAIAEFFFFAFLNEIGNSKLFQLCLISCHGTNTVAVTEQFTFVTMVVLQYYLQMIWRSDFSNYFFLWILALCVHGQMTNILLSGLPHLMPTCTNKCCLPLDKKSREYFCKKNIYITAIF